MAALTSVIVTALSLVTANRQRIRDDERTRQAELTTRYLNPLRDHVVEVHIRLVEILEAVERNDERRLALTSVSQPAEVPTKPQRWFVGEGCYLVSTAYLTALLFSAAEQVEGKHPFLKLTASSDTELAGHLFKVQRAFLKDLGIYYVLQPSIGRDLWVEEEQRPRTYREFCEILMDDESFVWFERLFLYYLETGRGEKLDRVREALTATRGLATFLDRCVAGGASAEERLRLEAPQQDRPIEG